MSLLRRHCEEPSKTSLFRSMLMATRQSVCWYSWTSNLQIASCLAMTEEKECFVPRDDAKEGMHRTSQWRENWNESLKTNPDQNTLASTKIFSHLPSEIYRCILPVLLRNAGCYWHCGARWVVQPFCTYLSWLCKLAEMVADTCHRIYFISF